MELDNEYYKKIIYKKNSFLDLKTYIKLNFLNKKILLISTKSVPIEETTEVLNSLFACSESVSHFVARNNFNEKELNKLKERLTKRKYDLIVSLGAGRCCDVAKYFAFMQKIQYLVCPTVASSLAYFTNYCINPYNSANSFYANMPNKIFIQESLIKGSNLNANISGLCFLNALRAVLVEGEYEKNDAEVTIFSGLEKLFEKLEYEQTNILLCDEDANLVLMDLFIDFGYYMSRLDKNNYYLFNFYNLFKHIDKNEQILSGKSLLLCAKIILSAFKRYFEIKNIKCLECPNCMEIKNILKKYKIFGKNVKNNNFFDIFWKKARLNCNSSRDFADVYKIICGNIIRINLFCNKVKSVYKYGLEIEGNYNEMLQAFAVSAFIGGEGNLVNSLAGSGVLNCLLNKVG